MIIGETEVENVISKFRVSDMNEKLGKLIDLCLEIKMIVGNIFFWGVVYTQI